MQVSKFTEKFNKLDGEVQTAEEEVTLTNGIYEDYLKHDNLIGKPTIYTGPGLTGVRITNFFLSTPSDMPWKKIIKILDNNASKVYITYQYQGDQVEAEDINNVQNELVRTQQETNAYIESNDARITNAEARIKNVEDNKYDKSQTFSKEEVLKKFDDLIDSAPGTMDTLNEIAKALGDDPNFSSTIINLLGGKVDKVEGKKLSTEDYSTEEKAKLAGIEINANNYVHPTTHPTSMLTQDDEHMLVTKEEKDKWNANSNIEIVNNLIDGGATKALSAEQGKVINTSLSEKANQTDLRNKNLIINGDFQVDQKNNYAAKSGAGYLIDRWFMWSGGIPTLQSTRSSLLWTLSGNDNLIQMVELTGRNKNKNLMLSFRIKGKISTTITINVSDSLSPTSGGTIIATKTIACTSDYQYVTLGIPASNYTGYCRVCFKSGNTNDRVELTEVQLEVGTVATPFVSRLIGEELALCKRYYQRQMMPCIPISANNLAVETSFNVPMRTSPTVLLFNSRLFCYNTTSDTVFTMAGMNKSFECLQNIESSDANLIGGYHYSGLFIMDAEIY